METEGKRKSEEVFKALEILESGRDAVERGWALMNNSSELRSLVEELNIREKTGPKEELQRLQKELAERLAARDSEKATWLKEWGRLRNELFKLTQPIIGECIQEISGEVDKIRKKHTSEIISKRYLGVSKTIMLRVRSNSEAIKQAEGLAKEGTSRIQSMHFVSIPTIEAEMKKLVEEIKGIDISKTSEKELEESVYFRASPPKGISSITTGYDGPLSGLSI